MSFLHFSGVSFDGKSIGRSMECYIGHSKMFFPQGSSTIFATGDSRTGILCMDCMYCAVCLYQQWKLTGRGNVELNTDFNGDKLKSPHLFIFVLHRGYRFLLPVWC